ncbi:PfkB family carbohydrate kinase [Alteribacillus sp. HJP-4]|uniref:PfkB family carbohydrate kinase n=1 Tax=Alteribacillus sp. HJP-4 TaxID=2775394 RepID=UPI0035CCE388
MGREFVTIPGGKGSNQAAAAARLGAEVRMIGCVGSDSFGDVLLQSMKNENIELDGVRSVPDISTGVASITVSKGENQIIVVPGANNEVTPEYVHTHSSSIADADVLLIQLEIPLSAIREAIRIAKENNVLVILNPAPIQELPEDILSNVDWLTPNELEADGLCKPTNHSILNKCIVTHGKDGSAFYEYPNNVQHVPAYSVHVIDTTGAGDTFNGALAVALTEKMPLKKACQFANAAAALSATQMGAQRGMPVRSAVEALLLRNFSN